MNYLNIISSREVTDLIPKGDNFWKMSNDFANHFEHEVVWFSLDEEKSYNFKILPQFAKDILKKKMGNEPCKDRFGIYWNS